ncbi:ATP-binding protein [Syntrophorhabdus aromaticivorans]|uniref:ATP-binding protein n=1 Tax=Syntrophorhabdus aromaticivorans TaxID=328301 RepID=UPI0004265E45|nr:ATP-binding protein [Syntrophorhabdus aromaticivorans]
MAIFAFDASHSLGKVRAVDTRRVNVQVNTDEDLRKARVGQLVALSLPGAIEEWLIGIIEKVIKTPVLDEQEVLPENSETEEVAAVLPRESVLNTVQLTLVGTVGLTIDNRPRFSRSLVQVPEIDGTCHILRDAQLQAFMNLLSAEGRTDHSLEIGRYTIDENAKAYLDGNKLFQRHASLLGSTGSGKSWTVASVLEQASKLPSANLIVFDLHGEYRELSYARRLRIPGPEELGKTDTSLLFLPYWLLNAEELQAMFIDRSEFSAHNQVMAFQDTVVAEKKKTLEGLKKTEVLNAFTLDSPIPFQISNVLKELERLNTEMVPGSGGKDKQGPFYGQFSRLLVRLNSKVSDKRYGFLFQAPDGEHRYDAMAEMVKRLMDYSEDKAQIKVIDFSEVPADVLPVIVGLVARIIYQVQFWTDRDKRRPMALVCDEAHLYLPKKDGKNPVEQRAIENFEKIAKEGRKYGVALLIVSQRPSDVSSTILSQCNNVIALRLSNGDDQATVKRLMPESLEGLMDTLPILDIGEALVVGDAVLLPSRIRIHPPSEKPLSATVDFWDEWSKKPELPDFAKAVENMRRQNRA